MSAPLLPIVAALEALEAGDVDLAAAILLGAVESDGGPIHDPYGRRKRCSCGLVGWPGEVEHHRRFVPHTYRPGRSAGVEPDPPPNLNGEPRHARWAA